uniref:Putative secreted protein n=1 Tax=Anopheles marajoara TaxID=58244 RepID=A0A2M4CF57_9DIPT
MWTKMDLVCLFLPLAKSVEFQQQAHTSRISHCEGTCGKKCYCFRNKATKPWNAGFSMAVITNIWSSS